MYCSKEVITEVYLEHSQTSYSCQISQRGSQILVYSHKSLTDLGLLWIPPRLLKDNQGNTNFSKILKRYHRQQF